MKKNKLTARRRKELLVYISLVAIPLLQFVIFYLYVNLNSIVMAFQEYVVDPATNRGAYVWTGLTNFKNLWFKFTHEDILPNALKNTLISFLVGSSVGIFGSLTFSFCICKKMRGSKIFRFVLFVPSMVPSIVLLLIFRYFSENALLNLVNEMFDMELTGLVYGPKNIAFAIILGFNIFTGFATMVLMFLGAMSDVDPALVEASQLDGASQIQEFFHVYLPLIYPTIVTFLVMQVSGIFANQMGLFSFFGAQADPELWTIGYYLFRNVSEGNLSLPEYCELSAAGVILTIVATPLTLGIKHILEKYGPSAE